MCIGKMKKIAKCIQMKTLVQVSQHTWGACGQVLPKKGTFSVHQGTNKNKIKTINFVFMYKLVSFHVTDPYYKGIISVY